MARNNSGSRFGVSLLDLRPEEVSAPPRVVRKVSALKSVEFCAPLFGPARPEAGSSKALGLRYERACAKRVKRWFRGEAEVLHNPWMRFLDAAGPGFACPDIVVLPPAGAPGFIFECKLSWTPLALSQLCLLYEPLLRELCSREFFLIVMCKFWRGERSELPILVHPKDAKERISVMVWTS